MILAIGAFDGFHRGHLALLARAKQLAVETNNTWAALTFSPLPDIYFGVEKTMLFTPEEKNNIANFLDVPELIILPFDEALQKKSPRDFLDDLCDDYDVTGIVVGMDYRFGYNASGSSEFIATYCKEHGINCVAVAPVHDEFSVNGKISTSTLRYLISQGKIAEAKSSFGFPWPLTGIVTHGKHRGTSLGFPTANLTVQEGKMLPSDGVYAASVLTNTGWYAGALSVGNNPTFGDITDTRLEVHLLDFSGNLYETKLTVFLEQYLRPIKHFSSSEDLIINVKRNMRETQEIFVENLSVKPALYNKLASSFHITWNKLPLYGK